MRFFVRGHTQNALFRRVRFSSPAQTSRHLTENRILSPHPHGKPHSMVGVGCRMQLWRQRLGKLRFSVNRRSQSALFRDLGLTECAFL